MSESRTINPNMQTNSSIFAAPGANRHSTSNRKDMCEGRIQNSGVRRRTSGSISHRPLYAADKKKAKSATRPSDYFPDIDEWPNNWMRTKEDLEIGRGLLA